MTLGVRRAARARQAWAGVELEPTSVYGVRVYQNGSTLVDHLDVLETHVISSILCERARAEFGRAPRFPLGQAARRASPACSSPPAGTSIRTSTDRTLSRSRT